MLLEAGYRLILRFTHSGLMLRMKGSNARLKNSHHKLFMQNGLKSFSTTEFDCLHPPWICLTLPFPTQSHGTSYRAPDEYQPSGRHYHVPPKCLLHASHVPLTCLPRDSHVHSFAIRSTRPGGFPGKPNSLDPSLRFCQSYWAHFRNLYLCLPPP